MLVATACLWSTSGVLVKSIDWNPLALSSARSMVALLTIVWLVRKSDFRRLISPPDKGQWLGAVLLMIISVLFVAATKLTTAANVILLQYTSPVWVAIFAPLVVRERTSGRDWLFIGIAFVGMGLFFMDSLSGEGVWGMILAIICGMAVAGLALQLRYHKNNQPMKAMIYGNILVIAVGLPFWSAPWPSPGDVGLIIVAGVFQFGLAYYLYTLASAGVTSLEMVLVTALEPLLNPLWVFLAIGEKPGPWALAGGAVVLITITCWSVLKTLYPSPALMGGSHKSHES